MKLFDKYIRARFFNWTPNDITAWEKIRQRGSLHFILGYSLAIAGILFVLIGGATFLTGNFSLTAVKGSISSESNPARLYLFFQLTMLAGLCLLGGVVSSLATWHMEEKIYQRIKQRKVE